MLPNTLTIPATVPVTFDRRETRPTSTIFSDRSAPLEAPRTLTIGHETTKSGVVSSAVAIISDVVLPVEITGTVQKTDRIRTMIKVSYNPTSGRTGVDTELELQWNELAAFFGDANNRDAFFNREI